MSETKALGDFDNGSDKGQYKRDSELKETDNDNFPKIPKNWKIRKLHQLANVFPSSVDKKSKDSEPEVLLCNYTDVYNNARITSNLDFMKATAKNSDIKKFQLQAEDVIVTKDSESWDDICVPTYVTENMKNVICGYHLAHLKPKENVNGKFLYYSIKSEAVSHHFHVEANGVTRYGISKNGIKEAPIPLPSQEEQEKIVEFLNIETSRIDKLIERKEMLLELLYEKQETLITSLVTGKKSDSELVESGVDWIEKKPSDWESLRLRRWLEQKIKDGPHETPEYVEDGVPFLSADAVRNGRIDFERRQGDISEELHREYQRKVSPEAGDIFLVKSGATTGKMAMVETEREFSIWSPIAVIRADKDMMDPKFLYYALKSDYAQGQIEKSWSDGTQENLGMGDLERINIIAPELSEQIEIVKEIEKEARKIEELSNKIEEGIERLKEYREALITEAVTGQIDVRGEV